jgi:hypothetical protein
MPSSLTSSRTGWRSARSRWRLVAAGQWSAATGHGPWACSGVQDLHAVQARSVPVNLPARTSSPSSRAPVGWIGGLQRWEDWRHGVVSQRRPAVRRCGMRRSMGRPAPSCRAVEGAGRLFSTPSRPACGRPPAAAVLGRWRMGPCPSHDPEPTASVTTRIMVGPPDPIRPHRRCRTATASGTGSAIGRIDDGGRVVDNPQLEDRNDRCLLGG